TMHICYREKSNLILFVCEFFIVNVFFFFQAEDGIRDSSVTGVRRVLFRSLFCVQESAEIMPVRSLRFATLVLRLLAAIKELIPRLCTSLYLVESGTADIS